MSDTIVLIAGETETPYLTEALNRHNPSLTARAVPDVDSLRDAVSTAVGSVRLIAFSTDVIVPRDVLGALPTPAYNFHPGPPEYPGSKAAGFAIYEQADTFGVTVHEMTPEIDAGRIVFVRRFPIPPDMTGADLEGRSYQALIEAFFELAPRLATDPAPLPPTGDRWRLPVRTRQEADELRSGGESLDKIERDLRRRAFGPPAS